MPMVNVKQDPPSPAPASQPPSSVAMLGQSSPPPAFQDSAMAGGFQPQGAGMTGSMQPQGAVMTGSMQPQPQSPVPVYQSPIVAGGMQPQNPVVVQAQNPVVVQPQATAPMRPRGRVVYGDHAGDSHPLAPDGKRNWSFGLFDCCGRCGLCCYAYWCPCIVFSKTRQRFRSLQYQGHPLEGGGDACSSHCCIYTALLFIGHPWIMQVQPRVEIRERYLIRGNVFNDWLASFFCGPCALVQERREVEMEEHSFRAAGTVTDRK